MLKTAMKPRFLRMLALLVVVCIGFAWLGQWQWSTAHDKGRQEELAKANDQKREPLQHLVKPQTAFNGELSLRPISVTGTYDDKHTELVAGRVLNGKHGFWLLTPLVVDGTGARIPIVRGFVSQTTQLPKPPSGKIAIEGALAPGESVSQMGQLPEGQIGTIDMGLLLNEWGGEVYSAFVFMTKQTPPTTDSGPGIAQVSSVPPPVKQKTSIDWRNLGYALQWWVFIAAAIYVYFRLLRQERADDLAKEQASTAGAAPDPAAENAIPGTSADAEDCTHAGAEPDIDADRGIGRAAPHTSKDDEPAVRTTTPTSPNSYPKESDE